MTDHTLTFRLNVPELYLDWYYSKDIWRRTTFLGLLAAKSVTDLWNYQEILAELGPSLVVEFGTFQGGSTLYLAEVLGLVSPHSRVLSVDLDLSHVGARVREHSRVELMQTNSTEPEVADRIRTLRRGFPGPLFALLDSDHNAGHVIGELELLRGVTRAGDYVVVEDGIVNGHPVLPEFGPGPLEALVMYMKNHPDDYSRDIAREQKFGFTFAPQGFLVRR
jgi:cephalosporin hydroxylase